MHIDSVQLLRVPLSDAASESGQPIESTFVVLQSGEHIGFGEVSLPIAPTDCDEWSAGALACLRDWLAPAVVGRSIDSGDAMQAALAPFCGNHAAKSALDIAWWSLEAMARNKPLHQLLGGTANRIRLSATVGLMDSTNALFAAIREALARYDLVTLKFRPGWDVEMLRAVRQEFGGEPIAIDCDGGCSLGQQEMFYRLEDFFLAYIEQPLVADDLVGHAMLQENLRTSIALDQSITSLARVEQALDLGSCRLVRINLARVGGITPALAIVRACQAAKVPCEVGGGPQGGVAASATAALATLCGGPLPGEAYAWHRQPGLPADNTTLLHVGADGKFEVRLSDDAPGLGHSIDTQVLADAAVDQATLR